MLRRHPVLVVFFFLLLLAILAVTRIILTFDLNQYREEIQGQIANAIGRPVTLGEAHLSLRHGPAFTFSEIRIPATANAPTSLTASSLVTKVKITPLLRGRIDFFEIVLLSPRLHLVLRQDLPLTEVSLPEWKDFGIDRLTILNGTITVKDQRETAHPLQIQMEKLDLRLSDLASGQRTRVTLKGELLQEGVPVPAPARLAVSGEIFPAATWREKLLRLTLSLEHLDAAILAHYLPRPATAGGSISLALQVVGSSAAGLQVGGEINAVELTAAIPDWYERPLGVKNLRLAGTWKQETAGGRLADLRLRMDEIAASGDLRWRDEEGGRWVEGTLSTPAQAVDGLARFLPDRGPLAAARKFAGGSLQVVNLHFAGRGEDLLKAPENLSIAGKFNVQDVQLKDADSRLGALSFAGSLEPGRLMLDGTVNLLGTPLRIAGTVERPFANQPEFAIEAAGVFPAARLLTEIAANQNGKIIATGPVPISGTVNGTIENLNYTIAAGLNDVIIRQRDDPAQKPFPLSGTLSLAGKATQDRLELGSARLQMSSLDVRGKGTLARTGKKSFSLSLDFAGLDLAKLRPQIAFIDTVEAKGFIDGACVIAGEGGRITARTGTLRLRGVGMRPTSVIAPVTEINGYLKVNGSRAEIEEMTAHLGNSPVTIAGTLTGPDDFRAELHVRGKSIRADELTFSSGQLLHNVDGRLRIDRFGIGFAPVTVRLDGGTEANVRGEITFATAAVNLDIDAPRGNIDEVIALWQKKPSVKPPEAKEEKNGRNPVKVRIHAKVGEGTLGELRFRHAEGEITYFQDLLAIFPLRFQIGPGNCQGRVAVEFGSGAPLLKISGHLEKVDAAAVYQQLLQRRGLITGTLHGDFYLEGRVGSEFLKTSSGGFSFETRDGVLRKFPILGKIFSLLNVSQILTLQLPDMARDGMPFQKLAGNFKLQQGVLSTEDLFLESPAMNLSLIGELNLPEEKIDMIMGIKPLRTVDRIITNIPLAGWLLAGEEKALITIHFKISGHPDHANVDAVPITSLSEKVFGIFRRVLNLPGKMIDNVGGLVHER